MAGTVWRPEGKEEDEEERHEEIEEVIGSIAIYGSQENERELIATNWNFV